MKEQILNWMGKYGEIMSEPMDILDRECPDIATGDISVIMKLHKQIPSFLPMYGKKIRVAYRGMTTVCSNCYDVGHMQIGCENERTNYLDYVSMLMKTERFERNLFGNWAMRAEKYQTFKEEQSRNNRRQKTRVHETIDEESFIDTESKDSNPEPVQIDEDTRSNSSYKSTETVIEEEFELSPDPAIGKVIVKVTSFESRTTTKK